MASTLSHDNVLRGSREVAVCRARGGAGAAVPGNANDGFARAPGRVVGSRLSMHIETETSNCPHDLRKSEDYRNQHRSPQSSATLDPHCTDSAAFVLSHPSTPAHAQRRARARVKHNHGVWTAIEMLVHSSPWRQTVPAHINSVTRSWHDNLEGWSVPLATSTDARAAAPFTRALGWIRAGTQPRVERQMKHGRSKCGMHVIAACSRGPFSRRPSMSIEGCDRNNSGNNKVSSIGSFHSKGDTKDWSRRLMSW